MSNVVVHGAAGRMGLSLIRVIRERTDLTARQKDLILGENAAALLNL